VLFLLLACCHLLVAVAQHNYPNLVFRPEKPRPGDEVGIMYDARKTALAGAEKILAAGYVYNGTQREWQSSTLLREGDVYKGSIQTNADSDGIVLTFFNESLEDNNRGEGYFTFLYDAGGNPVAGARGGLAAVYSLGSYTGQNPEKADQLLRQEYQQHPESESLFLNTYLAILTRNRFEDARQEVLSKLDAVALKHFLSQEELEALATWHSFYNQPVKAEKYKALLRRKHPGSEMVQEERIAGIRAEKNFQKKLAKLQQFTADFPDYLTLDGEYSAVADSLFGWQQLKELATFVQKHGDRIRIKTYNDMAWQLYEQARELELAELLAARAADRIHTERNDGTWHILEVPHGYALDTYGAILTKQGKDEEAFRILKEAFTLDEGRTRTISERYVSVLVKTKRYQVAITTAENLIAENRDTPKMQEDFRRAYIAVNGNEKGFDRQLEALEASARERMKKELTGKMISEPAPSFTLQDLNGNTISSEALKGKTVVVDFWATWCGPCVASMPGMQQAMARYKADPTVQFLFVNSWQREADKQQVVRNLLEKKKYDFTVPMDVDNKVIGAYKVESIPAKFIIDPQGNIRFKSDGFEGDPDALVEELSLMIDLAKDSKQ
jgi:thiol-disulfide isomerase/thioredoxin